MSKVESGVHLAVVRNWLKWHALNGSQVTWNSEDPLRFNGLTVGDFERLAQDIADAVANPRAHLHGG